MSHFECCRQCTTKRHVGCHGSCDDYKVAREKFEIDKAKEIQYKQAQCLTFDWSINTRSSYMYNET